MFAFSAMLVRTNRTAKTEAQSSQPDTIQNNASFLLLNNNDGGVELQKKNIIRNLFAGLLTAA